MIINDFLLKTFTAQYYYLILELNTSLSLYFLTFAIE
jgi:hypothetical protein